MINVNEIIKLHLQGLTNTQISKELNYSKNTITKYLKISGYLSRVSKENISNKIISLSNQGKTIKEIASILKISKTTAIKYSRQLNQTINSSKRKSLKNKIILTPELEEILYGSLLGDMSLEIRNDKTRFSISHGGNQESYFDHKCIKFENLLSNPQKNKRFDYRTNKFYNCFRVHSLYNICFTDFYNQLYINGVKTITSKFLSHLTPRSLAYWFMDDGSNCGILATNCFTKLECDLIKDWLQNTYEINTTILYNKSKNLYLIYFTKSGKRKFYDLTHKYFIKDMLYKVENWSL